MEPTSFDANIADHDRVDHEIGIAIILLLNLKRSPENGRVYTEYGDKTPAGLARMLRRYADPQSWDTLAASLQP